MEQPLVVAFVPGVTPTKWQRIWRERHPRRRLELQPASQAAALAALERRDAQLAFVRDLAADEQRHVIPLYDETSVIVMPREHLFAAADELHLAELGDETVHGRADEVPDADTLALVAAGVGVARMPQSVWRQLSRRDLTARPLVDAPSTRIGLAWPVPERGAPIDPGIDAFIGIVRGRTARSSRD